MVGGFFLSVSVWSRRSLSDRYHLQAANFVSPALRVALPSPCCEWSHHSVETFRWWGVNMHDKGTLFLYVIQVSNVGMAAMWKYLLNRPTHGATWYTQPSHKWQMSVGAGVWVDISAIWHVWEPSRKMLSFTFQHAQAQQCAWKTCKFTSVTFWNGRHSTAARQALWVGVVASKLLLFIFVDFIRVGKLLSSLPTLHSFSILLCF